MIELTDEQVKTVQQWAIPDYWGEDRIISLKTKEDVVETVNGVCDILTLDQIKQLEERHNASVVEKEIEEPDRECPYCGQDSCDCDML